MSSQTRFVVTYTISLVLCFSPIKSISLISPFILVFLMIFFVKARSGSNILRLFKVFFVYVLLGFFYFLLNADFLWLNFFFFIVTHSPFLFLFISFDHLIDERVIERLANTTTNVLLVEAIIGIVQVFYNAVFITHGFDGGTGDAAMGTINPRLGSGDGSASNVYFAIGLSALAVLAVTSRQFVNKASSKFNLMIIILSWILASVMHSIFILLTAIAITLVLLIFFMPKGKLSFFQKQLKAIRSIMAITFVVAVVLLWALPGNVELLKNYYDHTFDPDKMTSPKSIATLETLRGLEEQKPFQKYVGLGPGQYTSRASLILSDTYLNSKLPGFLTSVSPDLERYILPIWLKYKSASFQAGSTFFPFYSWLSTYGEWGLAGCIVLMLMLFVFVKRILNSVNQRNFYLVIGLLIILLYIFLLGVQDNYWEWAQFILPIIIYAKVVFYMIQKAKQHPVIQSDEKKN